MSTNKTENCHLHAWEAGDDFLRSEFNENFAKLDEIIYSGFTPLPKALKLVVGSYEGNDTTTREIDIGFRPRVVLAVASGIYNNLHTVIVDGMSNHGCDITDTGFQVGSALNWSPQRNTGNGSQFMNPFRYWAIWWED